jgi:hypothetical protein
MQGPLRFGQWPDPMFRSMELDDLPTQPPLEYHISSLLDHFHHNGQIEDTSAIDMGLDWSFLKDDFSDYLPPLEPLDLPIIPEPANTGEAKQDMPMEGFNTHTNGDIEDQVLLQAILAICDFS